MKYNNNNSYNQTVANAESVPETTSETRALDESEREYNRMISQNMTYHRMMMDDIMRLSAETESSATSTAGTSFDAMNAVSGLGTIVQNLDGSNEQLLKSAAKYAEQGIQRATTESKLNAFINEMGTNLQDDIKAYDAIVQKEGFDNMDRANTLNAALGTSQLVRESQKYALFIFGAFAMFALYKTVKHL
jgi:hypothetical protein